MTGEERCYLCDEPTGRSGRRDDSLYDERGDGPYCQDCWDTIEGILVALNKKEATDG